MRTHGLTAAAAAVLISITPQIGRTQQARLSVHPARPSAGMLVRLELDGVRTSGDSVSTIRGTMAGEPLHFRATAGGRFEALGAVPVDVSDSLIGSVVVEHESGAVDDLHIGLKFPHRAALVATRARGGTAGASRLRVDTRFTRPDADADARVERENQTARDIGRRAQNTPQLWTLPFLRPRPSRVTSRFGTGRVFNGRVTSSHLGVDYRGTIGEPIVAANRGVVALVAEFFLAGNVVYIDHGDGIVTGYFHMSKPEVAAGDTVERGQEIGLVGATGRVTGPHLHWSARFGSLTIDPGDLFELTDPFVAASTGEDARRTRSRASERPASRKGG